MAIVYWATNVRAVGCCLVPGFTDDTGTPSAETLHSNI